MCKILEDLRNESIKEGREEERKKMVLCLLEDGKYALEEIAKVFGLSLDEVKRLQAEQEM